MIKQIFFVAMISALSLYAQTKRRGFSIDVGKATDENMREITEKWNANIIRYHMRSRFLAGKKRCSYAEAWQDILDGLPEVLVNAKRHNLTIVLTMQGGVPNDNAKKYPAGRKHLTAFWNDEENLDILVKCWQQVVEICKNRDQEIWYNILNEPLNWDDFPSYSKKWPQWAQTIINAIRAIDKKHPIVVEVGPGGLSWGFKDFPLLQGDHLIYSVHSYQPHAYTHQGIKDLKETDLAKAYLETQRKWPGPFGDAGGGIWDKERIEKDFAHAIAFQKKHKVHIFVGEFSVVKWAPDAAQYLRECIEIFEKYGWDWSYHAFRESHLWDLEKLQLLNLIPDICLQNSRRGLRL
jgi:hypothetical protein